MKIEQIYNIASDIVYNLTSEHGKEALSQVTANLSGVAEKVAEMYGLGIEAANQLVTTLLLLGHAVRPEIVADITESADGSRAVPLPYYYDDIVTSVKARVLAQSVSHARTE